MIEQIRCRDLTSGEVHYLAPTTPCLGVHDGLSTTPTGYIESDMPDGNNTTLDQYSLGELPFAWDDATETWWATQVLASQVEESR